MLSMLMHFYKKFIWHYLKLGAAIFTIIYNPRPQKILKRLFITKEIYTFAVLP